MLQEVLLNLPKPPWETSEIPLKQFRRPCCLPWACMALRCFLQCLGICRGETESSWCQRKGREGLRHCGVAHIHVVPSLALVLHLLDPWGCSALAGKHHIAEIVTELPKKQMLLTDKVSLQLISLFQSRICREFSWDWNWKHTLQHEGCESCQPRSAWKCCFGIVLSHTSSDWQMNQLSKNCSKSSQKSLFQMVYKEVEGTRFWFWANSSQINSFPRHPPRYLKPSKNDRIVPGGQFTQEPVTWQGLWNSWKWDTFLRWLTPAEVS